MCSEIKYVIAAVAVMAVACTPYRKIQEIRSGKVGIKIVMDDGKKEKKSEDVTIDSIRSTLTEGPIIMNAIRDDQTGEMVATDIIRASKVTARFRNIAERAGMVSLSFDVIVPAGMSDSDWQLKICPMMKIQSDTMRLEPVYVTGKGYRQMQLRGYQRYRAFLSTIVTDTTDFLRMGQLELFLERYYPKTYSMKTDTTIVSESLAENLFGVSVQDAVVHYTKHMKVKRNEWKKKNRDRMFDRYVKDPLVTEKIKIDTVINGNESFIYRYTHTFKSRPSLKKVMIAIDAGLYERGRLLAALRYPDELTFYISSLSSLADNQIKYKMVIRERVVYDNTKALIDFALGSSIVDSTLSDNASELQRVRKCVGDVMAKTELELDSLIITASCSPEGKYEINRQLSVDRAKAVKAYFEKYLPKEWRGNVRTSEIPENWKQFRLIVQNDTVLEKHAVKRILGVIDGMTDHDEAERKLSMMTDYRYMREKLYPKLRSVKFDFYLHRIGMVKDTLHTTEIDTTYMMGLEAMKQLDYKRAVALLRPYRDYNAALAFLSADYNHSALEILDGLDEGDAKVSYLKALVLSRLGIEDEAQKYLGLSILADSKMRYRANLDPEMSQLVEGIKE